MTTAVLPCSFQLSHGDKNIYYILTEDHPYGSKLFGAGSICYLKEQTYLRYISSDMFSTRFWRFVMVEDSSVVTMDVEILHPLDKKMADFLIAISSHGERLNCFLDKLVLDSAMKAREGQRVLVDLDQQTFPGTICYIGKLRSPLPSGLSPVYFGVELQGDGVGKGHCDGTYNGTEYFKCKPDCGLFLPCNKLRFVPASENNKMKQEPKLEAVQDIPVKVGETVGFYLDDVYTRGVAMAVYKEGNNWMVKVCPEEEGATDHFREIPMDSVVKEELLSSAFAVDTDGGLWTQRKYERIETTGDRENKSPSLDVNSVVQIDLGKGDSVTGTIRWIGCLFKTQQKMAGIELDEEKGDSDGEWQGVRYFTCPPKRALFVSLEQCQPDMRFQCNNVFLEPTELSGLEVPEVLSNSPPLQADVAVHVLRGRMKGIQGHCNSCYMDAALFSLFSCTSVLDSMLFKPSLPPDRHIQKILRDKIVNPLRQNGFVAASSVMNLRHHLTEKGQCSSFATSEKDPEEFLNLIMHRILGIEPLLKLQSGKLKEQECYCYQIFMDKQEDLVVPNVQQLVEHSFLSSDLKLVEIPSCFILQMPRFGKEYKMFSKIIPSLELDITDLLLDSPRECFVCGDVATQECSACFKDKMFADTGLKQYCDSCCRQAHSHYQRKMHQPTKLRVPEAFCRGSSLGSRQVPREKLELFAVLCIETSHYVSFVKYGPERENWMFFDSMADRHGDESGFNIPTVTLCPEVAKYLEMPVAALAMEQPRDMEGVAKRLFCDAYMYMYQSKKMALYK
ncbi:ubiquitin carboxyl-terminal hydrolase CYLD-like [Eublepharis macularius]|uniref:Ubiquitin carboxyl-terminal hydrolase CYLD n=1 Tax=Eublepharis macularius TaxID=481883 RepID=A0AA97JK22_EUBMA|nr:ubiquitin carboxyl-terminal hydrolase CYLD-like [Eublepharis macularius]XP_054840310.1 ubiquitin carboxyl-terminal hydrolase CYLD-like [Eublepharis macularius]